EGVAGGYAAVVGEGVERDVELVEELEPLGGRNARQDGEARGVDAVPNQGAGQAIVLARGAEDDELRRGGGLEQPGPGGERLGGELGDVVDRAEDDRLGRRSRVDPRLGLGGGVAIRAAR